MSAMLAALLNSLWQAAAIVAATWTILRFSPRMNAATRYAVWWAVLAVVIALPAVPSRKTNWRTIEAAAPSVVQAIAAPLPPEAPVRLPQRDWFKVLPAIWLAALLAQLVRILWSYRLVRRLKRRALPAPREVQRVFDERLASGKVRRSVRLLISNETGGPLATGFVHPAVILPESLIERVNAEELDHVLLHEIAHLARRDDWTNLAARLAAALVVLHPVAAWILRRIEQERELACDEWVVAMTGAARPYAESLTHLFELCRVRRSVVLASGMADRTSHLGRRVESLLRLRQFSSGASTIKVAACVIVLLGCALLAASARPLIAFAQSKPAFAQSKAVPAASAPRGFLAALVAAGYGDLSVDEIVQLKDHGLTAEFITGMRQTGWGKLPPRDLINLHNHGVAPRYAGDMHESGINDLSVDRLIDLHDHGVRPEFVQGVHTLGYGPFRTSEIIDLQNHGVRVETFQSAKQFASSLSLQQIIKLKDAGVLR